MEFKEAIKICISSRTRKSVVMATLVARYHSKANQHESMQDFGMQRTLKRFLGPRNMKRVAIRTLVARCCRKTNQLQSVQGNG